MGIGLEESAMDSRDLKRLRPVEVIDARWAPCPGPLLEAKETITLVKAGEVIEIQTVDPEACEDISAWAGKVGHEFLGFLQSDGWDRIFVRKKTR
jgi:tRNA 2-thiouridine synthesizing protein A